MLIGIIGISHKEAPVELRERFAWTHAERLNFQIAFYKQYGENIIVSTCNRFELYFVVDNNWESILDYISHHLIGQETYHLIEEKMVQHIGEDAVKHLLRVATGLESMVIGEDQILGQVKDAWEESKNAGLTDKILNRLFQEAIRFSKEMRTLKGMSENPLSVVSIAIKKVIQVIEQLNYPSVMIVGRGEMGELCKKYLEAYQLKHPMQIYRTHRGVCNRGIDENQLGNILYEERYNYLEEVDCVISATSSPHPIFTLKSMPRRRKPLLMIDLAVPVDIEPAIGLQSEVTLINIDAIGLIAAENNEKRLALASEIEAAIELEKIKLMEWIENSVVDPFINSLHQRVDDSHHEAMMLIRKKIELSEKESKYIDKIIKASILRVLKEPILQLKKMDAQHTEETLKVLRQMFDLEE